MMQPSHTSHAHMLLAGRSPQALDAQRYQLVALLSAEEAGDDIDALHAQVHRVLGATRDLRCPMQFTIQCTMQCTM